MNERQSIKCHLKPVPFAKSGFDFGGAAEVKSCPLLPEQHELGFVCSGSGRCK